MESGGKEPAIKIGKYGVAIIGDEVMLFRATHSGAEIHEYDPLLEFTPNGIGVSESPCSQERAAELTSLISAGWLPDIGPWFGDIQSAYEHGMEVARGLPARWWYEVIRLPNGVIWIMRRQGGWNEDDLLHVIALTPDGNFIVDEAEVTRGLGSQFTEEVLVGTGSFSAAIGEAEDLLRWPKGSVETQSDEQTGKDEEE
jgi:hypothetical protein